ncbi:MAG: response regulator transcription factor [Phycisphaerae bacterium]
MRVLIVEDEPRLAQNVAQLLREQGSFAVDISYDGEDGRHLAMTNPYDLVILDLMLPKVNGLTILKDLRAAGRGSPVLILTARDGTDNVVAGLDLGCDDYLTKPFEMGELLARCKALIRRCHGQPTPAMTIGKLTLNSASHRVTFDGKPVPLHAMEYRLLEYLAMRTGAIVSKAEILDHLYGFDSENFSNVVEVYISTLRRKIDPGPTHKLIHTVRGQGYILGELAK